MNANAFPSEKFDPTFSDFLCFCEQHYWKLNNKKMEKQFNDEINSAYVFI